VLAEGGEVIIEAGGFILSLTPEAAEETSERLYECTALARGQRRLGQMAPQEG
jgi:hypothetical protein